MNKMQKAGKGVENSLEVSGDVKRKYEQASRLGQEVNVQAALAELDDFLTGLSVNTRTRYQRDITIFKEYMAIGGLDRDFYNDLTSWAGISWGMVKGFTKYLLDKGYAISTVNGKLSTVKSFAKVAAKAKLIHPDEAAQISGLKGYGGRRALNIDQNRTENKTPIRFQKEYGGLKKTTSTRLSVSQATQLKQASDNDALQVRDSFLMCLLLDQGLRCGEIANLEITDLDIGDKSITVYRQKVNITTKMELSPDTIEAAIAYIDVMPASSIGLVVGSSNHTKQLTTKAMSERAITKRVRTLGARAGIDRLSAHDCRHYAATQMATRLTMNELMDFFGWSSPSMAIRYIDSSKKAKGAWSDNSTVGGDE